MDADPTTLARKFADVVDALAECLATDVQIDPVQVIAPLVWSMDGLHRVATELSLAAMSVDEEAGLAARRAAEHFLEAKADLTRALVRLPMESPRGTVYGKRPEVTD